MKNQLLFFLFLFLSYVNNYGQEKIRLTILDIQSHETIHEVRLKDSITTKKELLNFQSKKVSKGYLLSSYDSISYSNNQVTAFFYTGDRYSSARILINEEALTFLKKNSHLNERILNDLPLTPASISKTITETLNSYNNNGYPFCKIQVDSLTFEHNTFNIRLNIDTGPFIRWTKIHIKGDSTISQKFISNLIRIKEGDVYSDQEITRINTWIEQINYLQQIKPAEVLYTNKGAELFLYLKSNPVSSVNGIVGLQPEPVSQRLQLTGELNLKLLNVLNRGELLAIDWRSIQPGTQALKSAVNTPFLLQTPFGLDARFQLYKRDTTFLETNAHLGVQYWLKGGNFIQVFYQNSGSNLLSGAYSGTGLNTFASVSTNRYGIGLLRRQLNYLPNPTKGFVVHFEVGAGLRKSKETDTSLIVTNTTFKGESTLEYYIPIKKRSVIYLKNNTLFYQAPEIYFNELFRFGGLRDQRGFNEEELRASTKTTLTIEYRFLLDRDSYIFTFYDQTWFERKEKNYQNAMPYGFGAGFSFGTKLGIFSISYALGQLDGPILIKNGKVHFGYIAFF